MASTNNNNTSQSTERKVNPVYAFYKAKAHEVSRQLRAEYDDEKTKDALSQRNHGVRCFMKHTDIVNKEALDSLVTEFQLPRAQTRLEISSKSAVDTLLDLDDPNSMVTLYCPDARPCSTIYGGIPHEVTDLALRSTLLWQLKSHPLRLSESEKLVELHDSTSFYLPNVQVRCHQFDEGFVPLDQPRDVNVTLMSDMESTVSYLESMELDHINLPSLMNKKLKTPFLMALRQNVNRKKLGLSPIRTLVIGDMALRTTEHGVNALFAQRVQSTVKLFNGCFDRVIVCCSSFSTRMYLNARE